MANYTQNITNTVRCFGNGPSTKWGQANFPYTMTWGTAKWGEGKPLQFQVVKYVTNAQSTTWERTSSQFQKVIALPVAGAFEMSSEILRSGNWRYVFTSDATEAEERDFASWTQVSANDATFTCQAAAGTSWSEV